MSADQAIFAAKAYATKRKARFEEPIVVRLLDDGRYEVTMPVEGASDPDIVIDPPEMIFEVDLESGAVTLLPAL